MKALIVVALVLVMGALGGAGLAMLRKGGAPAEKNSRMAWVLAVRVGLSIALFLFILLSWRMGWIQPTGLPTGR